MSIVDLKFRLSAEWAGWPDIFYAAADLCIQGPTDQGLIMHEGGLKVEYILCISTHRRSASPPLQRYIA